MPEPTSAPPAQPAAFNARVGVGLVLANTLLAYWYFFFYDVSENDQLLYTPALVTFVAGQWGVLAWGSARPWRRWFWVAAGVSAAVAGLLWLGYGFLVAFARGFNH